MPAAYNGPPPAARRKVKVRRVAPAQDLRSPDARTPTAPVAGPPTPVKYGPPTNQAVVRRNLIKDFGPGQINGKPTEKASTAELVAMVRYQHAPAPTQKKMRNDALRVVGERVARQRAEAIAPVLNVLDQTTRPLHAAAGAAKAVVQTVKPQPAGKPRKNPSILNAAVRGLQNKDKTTWSDVLGAAGVKNKIVRGVVGTVADVGWDPLTYTTGGIGGVAEHAAVKAAAGATRKALKVGLNAEQAAKFGQRAAKQAARTAPDRRGVILKFAGKEVPGVRRATAQAARPVKAGARKAVPQKVRVAARNAASDLNPNAVPAGVTRAENLTAIQATRTARAQSNRGLHEAQQRAIGIQKQIGDQNYRLVIDALEAGKVKSLPAGLQGPARQVAAHFKYIRRQERQAGINTPNWNNYVPHATLEHLNAGNTAAIDAAPQVVTIGAAGRKSVKLGAAKGRQEGRRAPLATLRDTHPGQYSEDLPLLYANRMASGKTAVARSNLLTRVADMGTPLKLGQAAPDLKALAAEGKGVYHLAARKGRYEINQVKAAADLAGIKDGRLVVISHDVVKRAIEGSTPTLKGPGIVHGLDKATSGFKRLAIATPGFHLRNFVGDTQNAYLAQPGHRIPGNMVRAGRTLKAVARQEKAMRGLTTATPGKATVKTKLYGNVTYDEAAKKLLGAGAARSGYVAREIPELGTSGGKGRLARAHQAVMSDPQMSGARKAGRVVHNAVLNREDLPRLTTAIEALRNGATWEQAASKVAGYHFDYQHLTNFERQVARRAVPFYTFNARNIPLQARTLVTKPGKYANYQKIREEAGKATGVDQQNQQTRDTYNALEQAGVKLPAGWQQQLSQWEQRNAGVPISWKGHKFTISLGLPLQDLNEVPGAAGSGQAQEYYQKAMSLANPIFKDPVEYFSNFSFFFRNQIERDHSPYVAAPNYVAGLPKSLRDKLNIVPDFVDKRTGKKGWGWTAKTDYLAKALPGTPNYVQQFLTSGTDRRGKGMGGKALAYMGVKSVPVDPMQNAINLAYARQAEIQKQIAGLRQRGIGKNNPTAEWRKLNDQLKLVGQIAYQGKVVKGYKVLPTAGGPPKPRRSASATGQPQGFFGGGSSSAGAPSGGYFSGGSGSGAGAPSGGFFG